MKKILPAFALLVVTVMAVIGISMLEQTGATPEAVSEAVSEEKADNSITTSEDTDDIMTSVDGSMEIYALNVGKADAIIIKTPESSILIDAATEDYGSYVVDRLKELGISRLDYFIISHFDKDHVGGAAYVAGNIDITNILLPDYESDIDEAVNFMYEIYGHTGCNVVSEKMQFATGKMLVDILPAEDPDHLVDKNLDKDKEYDNDMSLVARITYGERVFLFTGDIEKLRIKQMLSNGTDLSADWLKVPAHGRNCKFTEEFMKEVSPQYAVISTSKSDPADEKAISAIKDTGAEILVTDHNIIYTICDGTNINVTELVNDSEE